MIQLMVVAHCALASAGAQVPTPAAALLEKTQYSVPRSGARAEYVGQRTAQSCLDRRRRRIRGFRSLGVMSSIVASVAVPGLIAAGIFRSTGPDTSGGASPGVVLVGALFGAGLSVGGAVGGIRQARALERECWELSPASRGPHRPKGL